MVCRGEFNRAIGPVQFDLGEFNGAIGPVQFVGEDLVIGVGIRILRIRFGICLRKRAVIVSGDVIRGTVDLIEVKKREVINPGRQWTSSKSKALGCCVQSQAANVKETSPNVTKAWSAGGAPPGGGELSASVVV